MNFRISSGIHLVLINIWHRTWIKWLATELNLLSLTRILAKNIENLLTLDFKRAISIVQAVLLWSQKSYFVLQKLLLYLIFHTCRQISMQWACQIEFLQLHGLMKHLFLLAVLRRQIILLTEVHQMLVLVTYPERFLGQLVLDVNRCHQWLLNFGSLALYLFLSKFCHLFHDWFGIDLLVLLIFLK